MSSSAEFRTALKATEKVYAKEKPDHYSPIQGCPMHSGRFGPLINDLKTDCGLAVLRQGQDERFATI